MRTKNVATDQATGMSHIEFIDRGECFLIRFHEDYSEEKRKEIENEEEDDPRGVPYGEMKRGSFKKKEIFDLIAKEIDKPILILPEVEL